MKSVFFCVFMLSFSLNTISQELVSKDDSKIYTIVDEKAEPKDGVKAFYQKFISDFNTEAVPEAVSLIRFRLNFVIEKDGTLNDIRVVSESGSDAIQEEAIKVLKLQSDWKPAKQKGKAVRSTYALPIEIKRTVKS